MFAERYDVYFCESYCRAIAPAALSRTSETASRSLDFCSLFALIISTATPANMRST